MSISVAAARRRLEPTDTVSVGGKSALGDLNTMFEKHTSGQTGLPEESVPPTLIVAPLRSVMADSPGTSFVEAMMQSFPMETVSSIVNGAIISTRGFSTPSDAKRTTSRIAALKDAKTASPTRRLGSPISRFTPQRFPILAFEDDPTASVSRSPTAEPSSVSAWTI